MTEHSGISDVCQWVAMDGPLMIHKPFHTSSRNIYDADWTHFLGILEEHRKNQ